MNLGSYSRWRANDETLRAFDAAEAALAARIARNASVLRDLSRRSETARVPLPQTQHGGFSPEALTPEHPYWRLLPATAADAGQMVLLPSRPSDAGKLMLLGASPPPQGSVGHPGFAESLIPVWGSGREVVSHRVV